VTELLQMLPFGVQMLLAYAEGIAQDGLSHMSTGNFGKCQARSCPFLLWVE